MKGDPSRLTCCRVPAVAAACASSPPCTILASFGRSSLTWAYHNRGKAPAPLPPSPWLRPDGAGARESAAFTPPVAPRCRDAASGAGPLCPLAVLSSPTGGQSGGHSRLAGSVCVRCTIGSTGGVPWPGGVPTRRCPRSPVMLPPSPRALPGHRPVPRQPAPRQTRRLCWIRSQCGRYRSIPGALENKTVCDAPSSPMEMLTVISGPAVRGNAR